CLNGGQCVQSQSCDCSLYQATGHRCQTVPNPGFEREMTCRTWGQHNFETFDGLYFHFPGRCTYTLLRDCEETNQVHNDPGCGSATYACQRSVSLFLPWEGEVRLHATNVTYKGQSLQLPHHIHDLQLEQISQYVLVTRRHGFTLAWDGRGGSVYIKLSPEFVGRTCGLCGNFNADVRDDLRTSYGGIASSGCVKKRSRQLSYMEEVCAMLLDPPFQGCHDFVSPLSYMASCSNDLCTLCGCKFYVFEMHVMFNIAGPAKQCPLGLQYRECISCCPESCSLERTCIDSKLACLDGCYCPDGLIYEDGGCVTTSDCPCEYHGMFYPSGQTLQEECNNCTCMGGVWNCTDYSCPGECSVTGDMYFQSFDGRIYTFPATCQYVLAKSRNSGKFTVTVQNAPCGANLDGACIQSVNLVIDEDPRTEITLSHVGDVFMAGQYRISPPYSDGNVQELSSMFLQVRTAFGLRLQYNWKEFRLYLQADERWTDDTVGLCGTFNGNIQDDFLSPSGMIESTPQLFGNAWRVSSGCSHIGLSAPQLDPCDAHQQAVTYASGMCDVLNQDLFSACHEYLSPTPFHQQCRSDTCKCGTPCLCSALAHYARHCRRFSVIVDFRSHVADCAVACPASMQYGTCVSSCQRRCSALSVPQHCGEECEEGCVCPQGSFYNHRTLTCVHSECPCSFLGADYEPGDVIMTSSPLKHPANVWFLLPRADRLCPAGQLYQNCSEGEDGLLPGRGVACERTCESHLLNLTCSTHEPCVAGCSCPPGLLKHGDECFEPASCPCLWKGKEYYPGDRVSSPCHHCVCQHGTFQCVFRPCPSMCTAYGDRHYRTFDGLLFDYVGACKVYLVKVHSADVMLGVVAENVDCFDGGVICRKSLTISIGRSSVAFDDDSGTPVRLGTFTGSTREKKTMLIWPAGHFTVIHFPDDAVTVLWDRKTTVHVQVGPRWQGKLSGLCGNFDLKTVNEMRTPDNIDSPTPQEFGNSWTACVNSPDIRHPCSLSPLREPFAKRRCAVLLGEVFQACHPVVDVTWFYMNCLADTCACSRGGDCECFCTSVAAYAQRCCHQGVPVDWRSPSLCLLGKGPFRLVSFGDRTTLLAAGRSSGSVFLQRGNVTSITSITSITSSDTSRVSFEAADRPNYFLHASAGGRVTLAKWQESEAFWDGATFVLHRNTWIPGYDSLESHALPGFFLHATPLRLHLLKYRHGDGFRKATLFRLTDAPPRPQCQWRYDSCVSPCFRTCSDPSAEACVAIPQVEGCLPVCPPHMVLDEVTRRCVHVEDCEYDFTESTSLLIVFSSSVSAFSVFHFVSIQPPYAEMVDECTKYICVHNQLVLFNKSQICPFASEPPDCGLLGLAVLVDGDKCCPQWDCPCRCSVFPDLSVITFDGSSVAVYKAASYIVSQIPYRDGSRSFVADCLLSFLQLLWNFTNLCLVALNITHKTNHIIVNRLQRRVRAAPSYGFEIYDTGNMYLIRSPAGLRLQWYHSTGTMVIDTDGSGNKLPTMGLCGFCDGDPTNDLTLPNGTAVGAGEDPALFIDSWQVPNTTSYVSQSRRRELNCSTGDCSVCMAMLQTGHFAPCHAFVPPSTFCEVWVRDAEYVNNQCVALAAYVASCHKFNVCVEWRRPDHCPFACPDALRYQACVSACTSQSCPDHDVDSDPDRCSGLTEGCVCPEGTLLHRPYSALCVSPDKCACTDSSGAPRAHGDVWKASKDACCMYRCDNDTIVPVEYNCSGAAAAAAPACRRAGEVVIGLADDTSCCPQKVCVCNQSLCDLPPPECKYGEKLVSYYRRDSCCPHYVCECDPDLCESDVPSCREDQTRIATRADDGSCCLAHICVCSSSCAETLPLCQDGEVLTVDGNVTDRCCPAYQCVCEPYRCPQLTCPVGMSVLSVSAPGRCCPDQSCGTTCDDVFRSRWKKLEHQIFLREAVCVFGERGVLRPGQTLVEHGDDGLCHSRQCSRSLDPASGFHLLRTASVNCSAHCQPNQIYVPPRDQATCCGVCKNISCLHEHDNGTVARYKPGKSWVSNCVKFDCTDTLSGPTLVSYSFSCPPFNETECVKVNGKSCQKVTVRMTIRKNDCRSNRPVNIVSCDGKCPSASIYNYNINTYARFCKCCRETGLQRRSVQLYCSGNATWVSYSIQEPTDCSCQWS
uniref:Otogelin n=1 Tax=Scophthalmus maximus TaxID=52904 RepID=A0A8D3DY97_SCOMX